MKNQRFVAVHLLNDYSGSPLMLRQSIEAVQQQDYDVHLFTATPSGAGFLCEISGVKYHSLFYRRGNNRLVTLFSFLVSQFILFFRLLFFLRRSDILYVNTLLPFGAAFAGACRRCRVIYHLHEVSVTPLLLKRWLLFAANSTASAGIFVSEDVRQRLPFRKCAKVVYNALPSAFTNEAMKVPARDGSHPFTVLMACSLKKYKGVHELVKCAAQLPAMEFVLVLNADKEQIKSFFGDQELPPNLLLISATSNLHPWYRRADVVVNLSLPGEWIETFGMTILEAMYYGRPVIVPPVGGITELVTDGKEGYHVDAADTPLLCSKLVQLSRLDKQYQQMAAHAFDKARRFTVARFRYGICNILNGCKEDTPAFQMTADKKRNDVPYSGISVQR